MSTTSKPRDRLEALLTGLEDEVLRMDDGAALSPDEDGATMDIGELRLSMESVIATAMDVTERQPESSHRAGEGRKGKVAGPLELLRRWAGAKRGDSKPSGALQVRMAFSGEREAADGEAADSRSRLSRLESESKDKES